MQVLCHAKCRECSCITSELFHPLRFSNNPTSMRYYTGTDTNTILTTFVLLEQRVIHSATISSMFQISFLRFFHPAFFCPLPPLSQASLSNLFAPPSPLNLNTIYVNSIQLLTCLPISLYYSKYKRCPD